MTKGVGGGGGQHPYWQNQPSKPSSAYESFKNLCSQEELTQLRVLEDGYKKQGLDFEKALEKKWNEISPKPEVKNSKQTAAIKNTLFNALESDLKLAKLSEVSSLVTQGEDWEHIVDGVVKSLGMEEFVKHAWNDEIARSNLTRYENDLNQGWDHIKTTYARDPALLDRFDKFRNALRVAMEKEINRALESMNLPRMKWVAIGTAGAKSDIDLTANVEDPTQHSEIATSLAKVLFDAIFYKMAGGFSGTMIDLDTYTTHEGKVLTTPQGEPTGNYQYLHSTAARGEYMATELFAGLVELRRNCDSDEEFDKRIANFPQDKSSGILDVAEEVKRFLNQDQEKINALACTLGGKSDIKDVSKETQEKAFYIYKSSRILKIASEMDRCNQEILNLESAPNPDLNRLDELRMKWNKLGVVRELYLPRGYKSKGAYLVVCERQGGQREQRGLENIITELHHSGMASGMAPLLPSAPEEIIPALVENLAMYYHLIPKDMVSPKEYINASKYALRIIDELHELIYLNQKKSPSDRRGEILTSLLQIYGNFVSGLEIVKREKAIPTFVLEKELVALLEHEIDRNAYLEIRVPMILSKLDTRGKTSKQVTQEFKIKFSEVLKEIDAQYYKMFEHPTGGKVDPLDVMFSEINGEKDVKKFLLKRLKECFPISGEAVTFKEETIKEKKQAILEVIVPKLAQLQKQEVPKQLIADILKGELVEKGLAAGVPGVLFNPELDRLIDAFVGVVNHQDLELSALKNRSKDIAIETFDARLQETLEMIKHTVTTLPKNSKTDSPTSQEMREHLEMPKEVGGVEAWYKSVHPRLPLFELLEKLTVDVLTWSLEAKVIQEPRAPQGFMEVIAS